MDSEIQILHICRTIFDPSVHLQNPPFMFRQICWEVLQLLACIQNSTCEPIKFRDANSPIPAFSKAADFRLNVSLVKAVIRAGWRISTFAKTEEFWRRTEGKLDWGQCGVETFGPRANLISAAAILSNKMKSARAYEDQLTLIRISMPRAVHVNFEDGIFQNYLGFHIDKRYFILFWLRMYKTYSSYK